MPRSLMVMVTWCSASGREVQKSQLFSGGAQVGLRVALDGTVQVREVVRVAQEEDRGVVADQVPVPLLGVELHGEAADVAFRIRRAAFPGDGREAHEERRLLADLREDLRLRIFGDVLRDGERAEGARALGVHAALGDHLAVEVRQFFQVPDILQQHRTAWSGGHRILVVRHGCAGGGGQFLVF